MTNIAPSARRADTSRGVNGSRTVAAFILLIIWLSTAPLLPACRAANSGFTRTTSETAIVEQAASVRGPVSLPKGELKYGAITGTNHSHTVSSTDTMLDIARLYDLGFNEVAALYPQYDPWLPPVGKILPLPTRRLLPTPDYNGIVVNIPEMRLYYFTRQSNEPAVVSYPIGIGATDFPTPSGSYIIGAKRVRPTWYIPPSLQDKYRRKTLPPGPNNPLGNYYLGFRGTMYGIHGTNFPWSVGRMATHGCIRMYPEDIERFFPSVPTATTVRLVYEPMKTAVVGQRIYVEIHEDVYNKFKNMSAHARAKLAVQGLWLKIDQAKLQRELGRQSGVPVDITREQAPGGQNEIVDLSNLAK